MSEEVERYAGFIAGYMKGELDTMLIDPPWKIIRWNILKRISESYEMWELGKEEQRLSTDLSLAEFALDY